MVWLEAIPTHSLPIEPAIGGLDWWLGDWHWNPSSWKPKPRAEGESFQVHTTTSLWPLGEKPGGKKETSY